MGSGWSPESSHCQFAHAMRRSAGICAFGSSAMESGVKSSPHHGQLSIGMGVGLPRGLFLYWLTFARAESDRPSPFSPR